MKSIPGQTPAAFCGGIIQKIRSLAADAVIRMIVRWVVIFSAAAHLYRFVNPLFNQDSLGVYRNDIDRLRMLSNGRWGVHLYYLLRGRLSAPLLIGCLSVLFLAAAVVLTVRILRIQEKLHILLLCGILSAAPALTVVHASFIEISDAHMLSVLLCIGGVYLSLKGPRWLFPAAVLYALSFSIYQTYIACAPVILIFYFIGELMADDPDLGKLFRRGIFCVSALLAGFILYYGIWKAAVRISGSELLNAYNSVENATVFSENFNFPLLLFKTYGNFVYWFLYPESFDGRAALVCNLILAAVCLGLLIRVFLRKKASAVLPAAVLLVLLPAGANFVYFFYGNFNTMLTFPFLCVYAGAFMIMERAGRLTDRPERKERSSFRSLLTGLSAAVLILNFIIYSNQVYLKKHLEEMSTFSLMTRILSRMEMTEGYVPGETTVVFEGNLYDSPAAAVRPGFDQIRGRALGYHTSVTYYRTFYFYCDQILGYPLNIGGQSLRNELAEREEVAAMPAFPAAGCCRMIDGVLVVKVSP